MVRNKILQGPGDVVMRAAVKSQINLVMEKVDGVRQLAGVRDMIYPILWLHDGLETMEDPGTVSLLQTAVKTRVKANNTNSTVFCNRC